MKNTWVEIDLNRLTGNIARIRSALKPETKLVFVVKANAYGHGLREIARHAATQGVTWFAVAYLDEAKIVRDVAPNANIVILGAVAPGDVEDLFTFRLIPIIVDIPHAESLSSAARQRGITLDCHVKVDTGMGRFGVPWASAVDDFRSLKRLPGLRVTGICTHFASVEVARPSLGPEQVDRFRAITEAVASFHDGPLMRHVSSSRAFECFPDWDFDAVRPGIILYGYGARDPGLRAPTEPILQWKTRVMMVKRVPAKFPIGYYSSYATSRETCIATIAAGYADGYNRLLGNRGFALIHGKRYPVVGRVSMNWITLDVGLDSGVAPGDDVTLIGGEGHEAFWADEMARMARTIAYEMLTSIHPGAERIYRS
ncbi:MAG TPA: alanine racemase [Kiritimatiellia bacterium]|nr:alanine racemase [Kiritimatiellia bacterium]